MLENILSAAFVALLLSFVAWKKYKKHKNPPKQWEGQNPNERKESIEELRQNESKYRHPGGGPGF
jgi:hypothetical protein